MSVYVDDWRQRARVPYRGRVIVDRWSHLTADTDEELHAFAKSIGLSRSWAQHMDDPNQYKRHYDVTESRRCAAIDAGAIPQTWREGAKRSAAERRRIREATEVGS